MTSLAPSTELIPIADLRNELGKVIRRPSNPPECLDDLRTAIVQLWGGMDVYVQDLARSTPSRMEAVIREQKRREFFL